MIPQPKVIGQIVGDTLVVQFDETNPEHMSLLGKSDFVDAPGCPEHGVPFCQTCVAELALP